MKFRFWQSSHVGSVRKRNEDSFYCDPSGLFIVADGLGGHKRGDLASRVAAETASKNLQDKFPQMEKDVLNQKLFNLGAYIVGSISKANKVVNDQSLADSELSGMGTTLSLCSLIKGVVSIGHVGDSRVYLFRKNKLFQITKDHVETIDGRSGLTRAVGTNPQVKVDLHRFKAVYGDYILLCSDGLNKHISDREIQELLGNPQLLGSDPAGELVEICLERGGADNITVILIHTELDKDKKALMEHLRDMDTLQGLPFFKNLDYEHLLELEAIMSTEIFQAGECIIQEGEEGKAMYVMVEGKAKVSKSKKPIDELMPGDHFGEMSMFFKGTRTASVHALEETICLSLDNKRLNSILEEKSELSYRLLNSFVKVLALRLSQANAQLASNE